ncbi:MAG: RNA recognition motif domain-containing protein [Leptospira bouyouniensis]|uniref:RNA-binding protein n=1 Tax=Leptospira bouyouniensis TaxID=2484911 RepID=A0A7I0HQB1_9LEPT|nr:RNA-binding protein [Leptospira bouyouniensis]TGK48131.1 RNA-binding protein [Leptospira bouyouniensis]TGL04101.1 RNA-binding protein [Leptospira bouyouniensis]TGM80491.1 RNA-binding protein [Leptospira bouyouniensis]
MKLSIGNLPQTLTDDALEKLLSAYGKVEHLQIKRDKLTKVSLGYGTAEMADADAEKAITNLNGKELEGKKIVVVNQEELTKAQNEAQKKKGSPAVAKPTFGRNQTSGGGNTGVQRRGGSRGS